MEDTTATVSYPTLPMAIALPIFCSISIAVEWVPFLALYRVKNMPGCTMIVVIVIMNFFTWLNAILWSNDDISSWFNGHGLCDVEVIVRTVCATLISTSTACLTRNLAQAVDADNPRLFETVSQRRRRHVVEVLFVFGIPLLQMPLHYIPQTNRYAIVTIYGCADVIDYSWPTIIINLIWPSFFAILNCYYAILVMIRLRRHRGRLSSTLSSNGSSFNARRFLKLFIMSISFLILYLPVTLAYFYLNLPIPLVPYSWSRVHAPESWKPIIYLTTLQKPRLQYYGWTPIAMGFFVFLYYGMNNEAIDMYRKFIGKLGFARIWPSLLQPREIQRRASTSRTSWTSHFDLVSKAVHYFDSARKQSQATSTTDGTRSEPTRSRKGSAATFEHIALSNVASNPGTTPASSLHTQDIITPIPTPVHLLPPCEEPSGSTSNRTAPSLAHHGTRTLFSAFRTHMHLPFPMPLLSRSKTKTASNAEHDVEAHPRRVSAHSLAGTAPTVETNIWSSRAMNREDGAESMSPRMGSRAYRERERRENERDRVSGEGGGNGEGKRTVSDEVVVVEQVLERREESS